MQTVFSVDRKKGRKYLCLKGFFGKYLISSPRCGKIFFILLLTISVYYHIKVIKVYRLFLNYVANRFRDAWLRGIALRD